MPNYDLSNEQRAWVNARAEEAMQRTYGFARFPFIAFRTTHVDVCDYEMLLDAFNEAFPTNVLTADGLNSIVILAFEDAFGTIYEARGPFDYVARYRASIGLDGALSASVPTGALNLENAVARGLMLEREVTIDEPTPLAHNARSCACAGCVSARENAEPVTCDTCDSTLDERGHCDNWTGCADECGRGRCADANDDTLSFCETCYRCGYCCAGTYYCQEHGRDHCAHAREQCGECENCLDGCDCSRDDDDRGCDAVHGYSTNVLQHLRVRETVGRTYGIELEMEFAHDYERDAVAEAIEGDSILRKQWVCKDDASLDDERGVEIVSAPMSLDDMRTSITRLYEVAISKGHVARSSACGTHVHVGRDSVSPRTISRFWRTVRSAGRSQSRSDGALWGVMRALAGRSTNSYANWEYACPVSQSFGATWQPQYNGHYAAVSTSDHYNTYEVRMFAGARTAQSAIRFVETVDCLLAIAEEEHGTLICGDTLRELRSTERAQRDAASAAELLRAIGKRIDAYPALLATVRSTASRLSQFHATIEAARKATPKKQSARSSRADTDRTLTKLSFNMLARIERRSKAVA